MKQLTRFILLQINNYFKCFVIFLKVTAFDTLVYIYIYILKFHCVTEEHLTLSDYPLLLSILFDASKLLHGEIHFTLKTPRISVTDKEESEVIYNGWLNHNESNVRNEENIIKDLLEISLGMA